MVALSFAIVVLVPKITFLIHATYAMSLQMARSKITSFKTHIGDGEHIYPKFSYKDRGAKLRCNRKIIVLQSPMYVTAVWYAMGKHLHCTEYMFSSPLLLLLYSMPSLSISLLFFHEQPSCKGHLKCRRVLLGSYLERQFKVPVIHVFG